MTTIKATVEDVFNNRQPSAEEALDRDFAPAFRRRTNGTWVDRPTVLVQIAELRETVEHVDITSSTS